MTRINRRGQAGCSARPTGRCLLLCRAAELCSIWAEQLLRPTNGYLDDLKQSNGTSVALFRDLSNPGGLLCKLVLLRRVNSRMSWLPTYPIAITVALSLQPRWHWNWVVGTQGGRGAEYGLGPSISSEPRIYQLHTGAFPLSEGSSYHKWKSVFTSYD